MEERDNMGNVNNVNNVGTHAEPSPSLLVFFGSAARFVFLNETLRILLVSLCFSYVNVSGHVPPATRGCRSFHSRVLVLPASMAVPPERPQPFQPALQQHQHVPRSVDVPVPEGATIKICLNSVEQLVSAKNPCNMCWIALLHGPTCWDNGWSCRVGGIAVGKNLCWRLSFTKTT